MLGHSNTWQGLNAIASDLEIKSPKQCRNVGIIISILTCAFRGQMMIFCVVSASRNCWWKVVGDIKAYGVFRECCQDEVRDGSGVLI